MVVVVVVVVDSVLDLADSVDEYLPNLGNFGRKPEDSVVVDSDVGSGVAVDKEKDLKVPSEKL